MEITSIPKFDYNPGDLSLFQFIRGSNGADYHQEPEFYQFSDGELMIYWNAYDFFETSNTSIKLFSTSKDGGITWSDPQVFMADYLGGVPYQVKMRHLQEYNKSIMCFTKIRHAPIKIDKERRIMITDDYSPSNTRAFIRHSIDGGRTFDYGDELSRKLILGDKELPGNIFTCNLDDVLQLKSGRIVVAFNIQDPVFSIDKGALVCMLSDDNGNNWKRSGVITLDTPRGAMECQIVETEPDRLLCMFRTKAGFVYQSISEDGGQTWSKSEPTSLPSPESMIRVIKLHSGNLLVVWNNVSSTTQHPRHPLAAALSKDGGRAWGEPKIIADAAGTDHLSNHGLIQIDDGRILLGISYYRDVQPMTSDLLLAIFDEQWFLGGYDLPMNWKFRTDPNNIGEHEKWYQANPDAHWTDIRIDKDWRSQGHEYYGTAWYSVDFEGPPISVDKRYVLRFGAVDGRCWIWLDGKLIGSQQEPPPMMWDKSFVIDLGDALKQRKKHRLTVKVVKENYGAGIWKPVGILEY